MFRYLLSVPYARKYTRRDSTQFILFFVLCCLTDNLNLASVSSSRNMYRMYSEKGRTYEHSYHYIHDQGDEKIAFLGIDTCMDPG